jgi:hypothetical protein
MLANDFEQHLSGYSVASISLQGGIFPPIYHAQLADAGCVRKALAADRKHTVLPASRRPCQPLREFCRRQQNHK